MPRLVEPLSSEEKEAAQRIIKAFNVYGAFVFEAREKNLFFNVIRKAGLEPLINIRELRRRRVQIYVVLLNERPCVNECNYRCRSVSEDERDMCVNECVRECLANRRKYLIEALENAVANS